MLIQMTAKKEPEKSEKEKSGKQTKKDKERTGKRDKKFK